MLSELNIIFKVSSNLIIVTGQINAQAGGYKPDDYGTQFDDSLASQGGVLPASGVDMIINHTSVLDMVNI
jgi:hypothetical protein